MHEGNSQKSRRWPIRRHDKMPRRAEDRERDEGQKDRIKAVTTGVPAMRMAENLGDIQ
jgi:hypothetical protein